jgi:hypothetical protein
MFSLLLTVAVRIKDRQLCSSLHQGALSVLFYLLVGFIKSSHEAVLRHAKFEMAQRC